MWIRSVAARAFGDVTDKTLRFQPGLNIVVGANGTGKSTWHGAIYAALYGAPAEQTSAADRRLARRRPRRGEDWAVSSTVVLGDGREVEISQNLARPTESTAVEEATGADVSVEVRQPDGRLDTTTWLGLDRRSFAATAFVEQGYGLLVLPDDTSGQALRRAVGTGPGGTAVQPAIDRINRYRARVIGDATDLYSPYGQALERLFAAERGRAEQRSVTERLSRAASDVDSARQGLADVDRRLREARHDVARENLRRLESELEAAIRDGAGPVSIDPAVAEAEQRYRDELAELAALDAAEPAMPEPDSTPASDQRLRWYAAGAALLVGLVVLAASAIVEFVPGIASGSVTAGAALALGAWTARLGGGRASALAEVEMDATISAIAEQLEVVNDSRESLRLALDSVGWFVHSGDDVLVACEEYRRWVAGRSTVEDPIADLRRAVDEARRRVADQDTDAPGYATHHPYGVLPPLGSRSIEELHREHARAAEAEARAVRTLRDLEAAMAAAAPDADRYDAALAECHRLRRLDGNLTTTITRLEAARAAVHQSVAAELEHHLRDWLGDVTGGRYTSVRVDPESLDVFIAGPNDPEVDALEDSHGTAELVRLLLRLALFLRARGSERGTLLLDDVLAHQDPERSTAMIGVLSKIAKLRHQVILFTTQEPAACAVVARLTGTREEPVI